MELKWSHTHLVTGQSLFLPHVLEQIQCLRENTNLVPVRGEMRGKQHIPGRGGEGEGRGMGEGERERERERGKRDGRKRER